MGQSTVIVHHRGHDLMGHDLMAYESNLKSDVPLNSPALRRWGRRGVWSPARPFVLFFLDGPHVLRVNGRHDEIHEGAFIERNIFVALRG